MQAQWWGYNEVMQKNLSEVLAFICGKDMQALPPGTISTPQFSFFVVSQDDESCITYFDDCDGCQRIFDDDHTTFVTLDPGDGVYQKCHRFQINQTCVKTVDVGT